MTKPKTGFIPVMTDDPEEQNEQELNRTYALGQSAGLKQAAGHVMEKAKNTFERDGCENGEAKRLRDMANELYKIANDQRPISRDPE